MSASSKTDWFWSDWLGDQAVRRLTPAERGVWIDLLALMAVACPTGYLCDETGRPLTEADVGRVTNASAEEVAERIAAILAKGAASQDRDGRIYNRRMVRDAANAAKKRANGKRGGVATRLKWQALSSLPQQNAWQRPQQTRGPPFPLSKKEPFFPTAARVDVAEKQQAISARSLASALSGRALTREPNSEPAEPKRSSDKKPEELTLAEINAIRYGTKHKG
jgi:hypothetical protein